MRRTERRGWSDRVGAEAYAAAGGDTGDLAGAHHRSAGVRPVPARGVPRQSWRCEPRYRAPEGGAGALPAGDCPRSEEHTSELQSLMLISYALFCLKK